MPIFKQVSLRWAEQRRLNKAQWLMDDIGSVKISPGADELQPKELERLRQTVEQLEALCPKLPPAVARTAKKRLIVGHYMLATGSRRIGNPDLHGYGSP